MSSFAGPAPSQAAHRPASPFPLFHGRTALAPGPDAGPATVLAGLASQPIQQIVTQRPTGSSSGPSERPPRSQPGRSVSTPWPWFACRTLSARSTAHGCCHVRRKTTGRRRRRRSRSIWWAHAHVSRSPLAVNELEKHKHRENSVMEIPVVTACTVEDCAWNGTTRAPLWPSPWATCRHAHCGTRFTSRPRGGGQSAGNRTRHRAPASRQGGWSAVRGRRRRIREQPASVGGAEGPHRCVRPGPAAGEGHPHGVYGFAWAPRSGEPGIRLWHFRTTGEVSR